MMERRIQAIAVLSILILVAGLTISFTLLNPKSSLSPPYLSRSFKNFSPVLRIKMEIIPIKDPIPETRGSDTIRTYSFGKPPEFTSEREKEEWINKLIELAKRFDPPR